MSGDKPLKASWKAKPIMPKMVVAWHTSQLLPPKANHIQTYLSNCFVALMQAKPCAFVVEVKRVEKRWNCWTESPNFLSFFFLVILYMRVLCACEYHKQGYVSLFIHGRVSQVVANMAAKSRDLPVRTLIKLNVQSINSCTAFHCLHCNYSLTLFRPRRLHYLELYAVSRSEQTNYTKTLVLIL